MHIKLEHPAIPLCYAWADLLKDCQTLGRFCSRIDRYAIKIRTAVGANKFYHLSGPDPANKFKGDVFEIFTELLIKLSPLDDRIGIHDYKVIIRACKWSTFQIDYRIFRFFRKDFWKEFI